MRIDTENTEPFLKWAGGKRWLISRHRSIFPKKYKCYIEPFLGSGATYFGLRPENAILADINAELIEVYKTIQQDWSDVYRFLKMHQRKHSREYYYYLRQSKPRTAWGRAARFIYLNRTCWNGLYRVNKKGEFNVPIGTRNSVLLASDDFKSISNMLKNAKIYRKGFKSIIAKAYAGDFLFVDPPYTVQHNFNNFIKYNEKLFSWPDQLSLRDCLVSAHQRGVKILVTNADHPAVIDLYSNESQFNLMPLNRNSTLASKAIDRGDTSELVIRNYA